MMATGSRFLVLSSYLDVSFQDETKTTMRRSHNLQKYKLKEATLIVLLFVKSNMASRETGVTWVNFSPVPVPRQIEFVA